MNQVEIIVRAILASDLDSSSATQVVENWINNLNEAQPEFQIEVCTKCVIDDNNQGLHDFFVDRLKSLDRTHDRHLIELDNGNPIWLGVPRNPNIEALRNLEEMEPSPAVSLLTDCIPPPFPTSETMLKFDSKEDLASLLEVSDAFATEGVVQVIMEVYNCEIDPGDVASGPCPDGCPGVLQPTGE